jgi:hypothetical protein
LPPRPPSSTRSAASSPEKRRPAPEHSELEHYIRTEGLELLRQLLQGHLDLRALREERLKEVAGVGGTRHGSVERGHERPLATVVGPVTVGRFAPTVTGESRTSTRPTLS